MTLTAEMNADEFRAAMIAKMQIDMARLRLRHLMFWWAL